MDRDDARTELRAALDELASQVDDGHGNALTAVYERGRGRRHRRTGAMTGVAAVLLVVIVLAGIVIAGRNQSPPAIATGAPPRPHFPTPTATATVCTEADLTSRGLAPMPVATRVTKTEFSTGAELEPPDPQGSPVLVSPANVWRRAKVAVTSSTVYQLRLAVFTGPYPSPTPQPQVNRVLAWVVVRTHFPIDERRRSFPAIGGGHVTPPPCVFGTRYDVYDARTGAHLASSVTQ